MGDIKRYEIADFWCTKSDVESEMLLRETGKWVRYDDHAEIVSRYRARAEADKREIARLLAALNEARQEREALRRRLEAMTKARDAWRQEVLHPAGSNIYCSDGHAPWCEYGAPHEGASCNCPVRFDEETEG